MKLGSSAVAALLVVTFVASCGGGGGRHGGGGARYDANGPIAQACRRSDRDAASRQLCGCIQAAANESLSSSDQKRAAGFFSDPQKAQDIRQSDSAGHEAFWRRYKAFVATAEARCG